MFQTSPNPAAESTASAEPSYAESLGITPTAIAEAERAWLYGQVELAQLAGMPAEELEALYLHAYQVLRGGKANHAARLFLALSQMDRRQARFYVGLGQCLQHMHEFAWAQGAYEVALKADPDHRIAALLYAEMAVLVDSKAEGARLLAAAIARGPREADDAAFIDRAKGLLAKLRRNAAGADEPAAAPTSGKVQP